MKEQKKKQLVAALLLTSCLISAYILLYSPSTDVRRLPSFARSDTLITELLENFKIHDKQVRVVTTRVDSNFRRKTYWIRVPPRFSKTRLHAALNETFYRYNVSTPGKVIFPYGDIRIHLDFNDTVFRTVILQTDPELSAEGTNGRLQDSDTGRADSLSPDINP